MLANLPQGHGLHGLGFGSELFGEDCAVHTHEEVFLLLCHEVRVHPGQCLNGSQLPPGGQHVLHTTAHRGEAIQQQLSNRNQLVF